MPLILLPLTFEPSSSHTHSHPKSNKIVCINSSVLNFLLDQSKKICSFPNLNILLMDRVKCQRKKSHYSVTKKHIVYSFHYYRETNFLYHHHLYHQYKRSMKTLGRTMIRVYWHNTGLPTEPEEKNRHEKMARHCGSNQSIYAGAVRASSMIMIGSDFLSPYIKEKAYRTPQQELRSFVLKL